MADFTRTFRRTTYPAISPTTPSRSQRGRTVMVAGGSSGIGFNIAQAFAEAKTDRIILLARNQQRLDEAVSSLADEIDEIETEVVGIRCDISDEAQIQSLWTDLADRNTQIDILILNAGTPNPNKDNVEGAIESIHFGMISNLRMFHAFRNQRHYSYPASNTLQQQQRQKFLINITTAAIHCYPFASSTASTAANAGFVSYLAHIADHISETEMRIVNLHPGCVFTERSFRASGQPREAAIWNDPMLSAHVAVWTTDKENSWIHGRFVWANWDMEELVERKDDVSGNAGLLKVGIMGVDAFNLGDLFKKCSEVRY